MVAIAFMNKPLCKVLLSFFPIVDTNIIDRLDSITCSGRCQGDLLLLALPSVDITCRHY